MESPFKVMGRRVVAWFIDVILLSGVWLAVFFSMAQKEEDIITGLASGDIAPDESLYVNLTINDTEYSIVGGDMALFSLIILVVHILYWWVLQGTTGRTLGKAITGIRVVRDDGRAPGIGRAAARWFLWLADAFPYVIPGLTGFIVGMTNDERQRIGDKVAGTWVVRNGPAGQPVAALAGSGPAAPPVPPAPPPDAPPPAG